MNRAIYKFVNLFESQQVILYTCSHSDILDTLAKHEDHVQVVWLPKYSPELNLIEGLWGYLKQSALNNYFYGDLESLESAVDEACKELQQHPETTLSLTYKMSKNLRKTA